MLDASQRMAGGIASRNGFAFPERVNFRERMGAGGSAQKGKNDEKLDG